MELVITENVSDIEYSYDCTGKSEGKAYKIKYTIRFFSPQVAEGDF